MDKKKNKKTVYLSKNIAAIISGLFIYIAVLLIYLLVKGIANRVSLLFEVLLLLLPFFGFIICINFFVIIPYTKMKNQLQRFNEGFISTEDINNLDIKLCKDIEMSWNIIYNIFKKNKNLDFSKRQAQYRALQNQINPHFLYNTLDGIRSEAIIAGNDRIADMTEALAVFFRYTISKVEDLVKIKDELDNCRIYFKIQQYRFGDRIKLEIEEDEEDKIAIRNCLIPKLTLQPVLENSIIHGTELKLGTGISKIILTRKSTGILIKVSDNGVGIDEKTLLKLNQRLGLKEDNVINSFKDEMGGIALTNVNNRIHLLFGEEYGLHIYSIQNIGTTVEIFIPFTEDKKEIGRELYNGLRSSKNK